MSLIDDILHYRHALSSGFHRRYAQILALANKAKFPRWRLMEHVQNIKKILKYFNNEDFDKKTCLGVGIYILFSKKKGQQNS